MTDKTLQRERKLFDTLAQQIHGTDNLLYVGYLLQRGAHLYANDIALIYRDISITYQELYARTCVFSGHLKERGLKPKDRVLICFENSPAFYIAYFAVLHCGAIVTPLNIFLKEKELEHIINDA